MPFNHDKLCGRITEKFGSQAALAKYINWPESKLSNRLNNKIQFDADEILMLCAADVLDIAPEDIHLYFFAV